ncbi:hypothetical protein [Streptomyces sp. SID3343]|uniref:AbiTii domain-containing protein n=1 Tax=Streptomyces sp. SID3343 TaxID=2690260 RepID=UPI00136B6686|nr:hypothetical protein [Streptomyces sp. SID3343]MYV99858.1 hypothetical protein [Streptomyces sp. SID3343]
MNRQGPTEPTRKAPGDSSSLASLLRRYVALGNDPDFAQVRAWARRELRGYDDAALDDLPAYRLVEPLPEGLEANAEGSGWKTLGERVDVYGLPQACRAWVPEQVPLRHGVDEIESLIAARTCFDHFIAVSPPRTEEIALVLTENACIASPPFLLSVSSIGRTENPSRFPEAP